MSFTQVSSSTNPNQMLSSAIAAVTLKPSNNQLGQSPSSGQNMSTNGFYDTQVFAKSNVVAKHQQNNLECSENFNEEQFTCLQYFDSWDSEEQTEFVENLLRRMCHYQHDHINSFLRPMLQRDFISLLPCK